MKALRLLALLCLPLALSSCKLIVDFFKGLCPEPAASVTDTVGASGGSVSLEDEASRLFAAHRRILYAI